MHRPFRRIAPVCASLILAPAPLHAQQANGGAQVGNGAPQPMLDPESPMADLPGLDIAWPDLATAPGGAAPGTPAATQVASESRYSWTITGLDAASTPLLRQRFAQLSVLDAHDGDPANAAQIDRRAREDAQLLTDLLHAEGYYAARVATRVEPQGDGLRVTLEAEPGPIYRLAHVELDGFAAAGDKAPDLVKAFGVKDQDAVDADQIAAGMDRLRTEIGQLGFPFAKLGEPEVTVDHATRTATLELALTPGGERRIGAIRTTNDRVFDGDHVAEIARFRTGETYTAAGIDDLRRALVQTGLVSSVKITPKQGATPDTVDLEVALEPAPPRTIAGELGYGTGEGARAELSWTHRNLFKPEGALTLRGVLGTQEQLGSVIFRRNNFEGRDRVLTAQIVAAHLQRTAYDANTLTISGTLERQTNIFFQKAWAWSLGGELVASDERDVDLATNLPRRRTYFVAAAPTQVNYDGSDDLLNPTRGFRLGGRVSPELSLVGKAFGYTRVQLDASAYQPVGGVVVAGRMRLGTILGANRDAIAPSRRFYAGGGASVRGYGYQDIGPRDANDDPVGGRSLAEFSIEARVKAFGNFGVVPFLDAGNIYTRAIPDFTGFRFGTGIGVRYYSSFGPIRIDVGTPINPQPGDPRVAVYVSLGQAF
jgi:translocation and assembly module TamA